MSLTFAGVPLMPLGSDSPIVRWVEDNIRLRHVFPMTRTTWRGAAEFGGFGPDKPIRPYILHWPVGATRWAQMHVIASERQLELIRSAVTSLKVGTLYISWEDQSNNTVDAISVNMTMLAPKPLVQLGFPSGTIAGNISEAAYLLSFVDDRYHWWAYQTPGLFQTNTSRTWPQIIGDCATRMSITITQDNHNAAYDNATVNSNDLIEFIPTALDTAAFYSGLRITRALNNTVKARAPASAKTDAGNNTAIASARSLRAGGAFSSPDYVVPSAIKVLFPVGSATLQTYYEDLSTIGPSTAGTGVVGDGETKDLFSTFQATAGSPPGNKTTLDAITNQMATDWYLWARLFYDVKYHGIVSFNPDAYHDIEWTYREGEVSSRLIPWQYETLYPICCSSGGGGTTTNNYFTTITTSSRPTNSLGLRGTPRTSGNVISSSTSASGSGLKWAVIAQASSTSTTCAAAASGQSVVMDGVYNDSSSSTYTNPSYTPPGETITVAIKVNEDGYYLIGWHVPCQTLTSTTANTYCFAHCALHVNGVDPPTGSPNFPSQSGLSVYVNANNATPGFELSGTSIQKSVSGDQWTLSLSETGGSGNGFKTNASDHRPTLWMVQLSRTRVVGS